MGWRRVYANTNGLPAFVWKNIRLGWSKGSDAARRLGRHLTYFFRRRFCMSAWLLSSLGRCSAAQPKWVIWADSPANRLHLFTQTINWLIIARGIAGIGGGGIVSSVWVITAEIVEVQNRAKWSQALSVTWSCSAIAGPLLGGLFSCERAWYSLLS